MSGASAARSLWKSFGRRPVAPAARFAGERALDDHVAFRRHHLGALEEEVEPGVDRRGQALRRHRAARALAVELAPVAAVGAVGAVAAQADAARRRSAARRRPCPGRRRPAGRSRASTRPLPFNTALSTDAALPDQAAHRAVVELGIEILVAGRRVVRAEGAPVLAHQIRACASGRRSGWRRVSCAFTVPVGSAPQRGSSLLPDGRDGHARSPWRGTMILRFDSSCSGRP